MGVWYLHVLNRYICWMVFSGFQCWYTHLDTKERHLRFLGIALVGSQSWCAQSGTKLVGFFLKTSAHGSRIKATFVWLRPRSILRSGSLKFCDVQSGDYMVLLCLCNVGVLGLSVMSWTMQAELLDWLSLRLSKFKRWDLLLDIICLYSIWRLKAPQESLKSNGCDKSRWNFA